MHDDRIALAQEEAHHLARSRRLSAGDEVVLFDGRGREARAVVVETGRRAVLRVTQRREIPAPHPAVHLGVSLPKGRRQDWLVEKCTELGATSLRPLLTARSVVQPANWPAKRARFERTCIEACKQSGSAHLPSIGDPASLGDLLAAAATTGVIWLCHPSADAQAAPDVRRDAPCDPLTILIGPEGGFEEAEVRLATERGALLVGLGQRLLRTETAALAALAAVRLDADPPVAIARDKRRDWD